MKEEILKTLIEFQNYVNNFNAQKKDVFEDDIELTLENLIKWLTWEQRGDFKAKKSNQTTHELPTQ